MDLPPAMTVMVVVGVLLTLAITLVAIFEYPSPLALPIAFLASGAAIWALPFAIAFHTEELARHVQLQRIRYLGTVMVPLAYYTVVCQYAGYRRYLRPRVLGPLAIPGLITLLLVWTHGRHQWFWQSIEVEQVAGVWIATFSYGPWVWVHLAWSYALVLFALAILIREVSFTSTHHRNQAIVVFVGGAVPFALSAAHFANLTPFGGINPTPIAVAIGGSVVGVGLLLLELVELQPVARDRVIEQLRDGVIVLDTDGRLRDRNPVASEILSTFHVGDGDIPDSMIENGTEIEAVVDGEERSYRVDTHTFHDPAGRNAGRIVYLNDITEIARREQRISVLHRVLRHNIRNEMTVLLGHLEYVQDDSGDSVGDDVVAVERSADRIMSFAENARIIERTLKEGESASPVPIDACIREAIDGVPDDGREVGYAFDVGNDAEPPYLVAAVDRELLRRAIAELIENAIVHGSGRVAVETRIIDGYATLRVLDEGPGIPDGELEALQAPVETALEHGSGLGLWVARWTADLSGGELRFGSYENTNVVSLRLPVADGDGS